MREGAPDVWSTPKHHESSRHRHRWTYGPAGYAPTFGRLLALTSRSPANRSRESIIALSLLTRDEKRDSAPRAGCRAAVVGVLLMNDYPMALRDGPESPTFSRMFERYERTIAYRKNAKQKRNAARARLQDREMIGFEIVRIVSPGISKRAR